jgi:hypothetical protein
MERTLDEHKPARQSHNRTKKLQEELLTSKKPRQQALHGVLSPHSIQQRERSCSYSSTSEIYMSVHPCYAVRALHQRIACTSSKAEVRRPHHDGAFGPPLLALVMASPETEYLKRRQLRRCVDEGRINAMR